MLAATSGEIATAFVELGAILLLFEVGLESTPKEMTAVGVPATIVALVGVVAGLRGLGAGGTFEGVALYAEWTTDAADWAAYERYWRNRME